MDPFHIHNLLRQIANEVNCPHCNAKVRPDMVGIDGSGSNYCLLKIRCHICDEIFYGHAHIGVKVVPPVPENILPKENSAILPPAPETISQNDIHSANSELTNAACTVQSLFPQK